MRRRVCRNTVVFVAASIAIATALHAQTAAPKSVHYEDSLPPVRASADVPLDDSAYSAIERLAALGYIDTAFLGIKPWTRAECARLVEEAGDELADDDGAPPDIQAMLATLEQEFAVELRTRPSHRVHLNSVYERTTFIRGMPISDGYHFGQTITNDYGRPFAEGFNQVAGIDASSNLGRFEFRIRDEIQHAPGLPAFNPSARQAISAADALPEQPALGVAPRNKLAILDATAAVALGGFQITAGKQSLWWGPGRSGAMLLSDNAAPIYMLRVSQIRPVQLPSLFTYLGPMKVESFFGHLDGHNFPPSPFFYGQKVSFKPTPDLEFGFSRTVVFAGQGVTPLTFGNFFHSFFSTSSGTAPGFDLRTNPGVRHAGFDFSYRLPGLRRWGVVLYSDSVAHDDVSPVSAPRRAAMNPGLYVARLPMAPKLEFRTEVLSTDPPVQRSNGGKFLYWESIYRDAYTNQGGLMGSWIGREGKGGQAWLTYHHGPQTRIEFSYRRAKLAKDFIAGGGTQDDVQLSAEWRLRPQVQARATFQVERWLIPALNTARQSDAVAGFEVRWLNIGHR
jgi:hypothetical protein